MEGVKIRSKAFKRYKKIKGFNEKYTPQQVRILTAAFGGLKK